MKVAKIHKDAIIPTRKFELDAGIDFYSLHDTTILARSSKIVNTGIAVQVNPHQVLILKPKGKDRWLIGSGVVDCGYTGEILVRVVNPYDEDILIRKGQAFVQGLVIPIRKVEIEEYPLNWIQNEESERGGTGGIVNEYEFSFGEEYFV